jgi:hypothetical protein
MDVAPSQARKFLIDDTVSKLRHAGIWDKLDILVMLRAHDSQVARINWIDPTKVFTEHGTVTFNPDSGYTGDGSTGYLRGITNMNALTNFSLDSITTWALIQAITP